MASGPLRFPTPHIEELPTTQSRQAPGFAWVASAATTAAEDPSKNWGTTNRKRARASAGGAGPTDSQREALSARQQREIDRRIRDLNSDNSKDVQIPIPKRDNSGAVKVGRTPATKKILASGKTFAHYLDDEEAEIARTGKRDGDAEVLMPGPSGQQRASKTPLARRKPRESSVSKSNSPAPAAMAASSANPTQPPTPSNPATAGSPVPASPADVFSPEDEHAFPTPSELEALLDHPPLTYTQARSAPPPASAPPPRRFCEVCGFFGRAKCMKCGLMTCSVVCKDAHDEQRCLKFYA